MKKVLTARVEEEVIERIKELSRERGMTESSLVNEILCKVILGKYKKERKRGGFLEEIKEWFEGINDIWG